jgi:hypothetical protein
MKLEELNVYVSREKLVFESPQASRPLEMANLVAYRIDDGSLDVVSVGESPLVNPPEDDGGYYLSWRDETDGSYYDYAVELYDFSFDNTSMFLANVYRKFLKEGWPCEGVTKKDFENIALNIRMPDDYNEYLDEVWLGLEYLIQTKTRIRKLTINGVESKWRSSDARLSNISFFVFFMLSFFAPMFIAFPFTKFAFYSSLADRFGFLITLLCLFFPAMLMFMLIFGNIINVFWVILMRVFLPLDLIKFAFDFNNLYEMNEGMGVSYSHWLVSKILFPK